MMTRSSNIGSIDIRLVFDNPNEWSVIDE
jgi:hypothetical protein